MSVDIYAIREMARPLNKRFAPKTFLQKLFVKRAVTHETRAFSIDKVTGGRMVAVFSSPVRKGVPLRHRGMSTQTITPGYIKISDMITPGDTQNRMPGEEIYGDHSDPNARAAVMLAEHLREMDDAITRREELMASQALTTGKVTIVEMADAGNVVDTIEIDFGQDEDHITAPDNLWDGDSADPIKDLSDWGLLLAKDSGMNPNVAILAADVVFTFLNDEKVQKWLDLRYANVAELRMQLDAGNGACHLGVLRAPGCTLELYSYNEWYADPATGTLTSLMPAKKVLLGNTNARCEMHYRVIEDFDIAEAYPEYGGIAQARLRRFPKAWRTKNPSAINLLLQSGPCFVPVDLSAFLCATVVSDS